MPTTKREQPLGSLMGIQNVDGATRHGQSCFTWVYPLGERTTRKRIREYIAYHGKPEVLDNDMGEPRGPIDEVMAAVMANYIQYIPEEDDFHDQLDGLQAGAGYIYGAMVVAKRHGATIAYVTITSNDGNLDMVAINPKTGFYMEAVHHVYYGS
jgi:hypothetical protein